MFPSERLKGIDVFVCVAEAGSFTAAAQRLHLTTSAVSKAVAGWKSGSRYGYFYAQRATWR